MSAPSDIQVSFVIPTRNEREHIGRAIDSIWQNVRGICFEIIVVDNGSSDETVSVASGKGARVLVHPSVTISALRNLGAAEAGGEILVFVDADVSLCPEWPIAFRKALHTLRKNPSIVTGSTYGLPENPSWVERCWYEPVLNRTRVNYINGGHLIVARDVFWRVGGFDETLETGEDYDFCQRARKAGILLVNNQALKVIHHGYPKTLKSFFLREKWHGRGDFHSPAALFKSRPALAALGHMCLLLTVLSFFLLEKNVGWILAYAGIMGAVCLAASVRRCGTFTRCIPTCTVLHWVYFAARGASFFEVVAAALRANRAGRERNSHENSGSHNVRITER